MLNCDSTHTKTCCKRSSQSGALHLVAADTRQRKRLPLALQHHREARPHPAQMNHRNYDHLSLPNTIVRSGALHSLR